MTTFKELGLPSNILKSIEKMGFSAPTPIQEQAIPVALAGNDVLGSAQTGTGKTASFMIPILCHLFKNEKSSALVILPTRELSMQVVDAAREFMNGDSSIKIAQLIGGDSMLKQINSLNKKPRLVIGTPGRMNDHIKRGNLKLKNTDFLVLDETDRMLDMGFGVQIETIVNHIAKERQTLMFSATLPKNIIGMAEKYLNNPVRISIGDTNAVAKNIRQELVKTSESEKYPNLISQISDKTGSTIIFVKTKVSADRLAVKLSKDNMSADAIHGDLRQSKRQAIINSFRNQKFKILVATDIAARGIDIPHIENVVNYDLPQCPEDYIHRIGRTARAGESGIAINLLTPQDGRRWKDIHKLLNPNEKLSDEFTKAFNDTFKEKRGAKKSFNSKNRKAKNFFKDARKSQNDTEIDTFFDRKGNDNFSKRKKSASGKPSFSRTKKDFSTDGERKSFSSDSRKRNSSSDNKKRGFSSSKGFRGAKRK